MLQPGAAPANHKLQQTAAAILALRDITAFSAAAAAEQVVRPQASVDVARAVSKIVADIQSFQPAGGNWRPLDDLFAELWSSGKARQHIPALLAVLERFPENDGAGVLWSVVHGVESFSGYEPDLVQSIQRQPSELGITMIGRLLNSGVRKVGNVDLVDLLGGVADRPDIAKRLREIAGGFVADHSPA